MSDDSVSRQAVLELVRDVCNSIMDGCASHYDVEVDGDVFDDIHEVSTILKCNKEVRNAIRNMPSAQLEIIRCKECKHYVVHTLFSRPQGWCERLCDEFDKSLARGTEEDDFCSRAERRTDE